MSRNGHAVTTGYHIGIGLAPIRRPTEVVATAAGYTLQVITDWKPGPSQYGPGTQCSKFFITGPFGYRKEFYNQVSGEAHLEGLRRKSENFLSEGTPWTA